MTRSMLIAVAVLPLAACAGAGSGGPETPVAAAQGPCKAEGLERFTGQKVTDALGAEIMKASGAKTLRWGGPDMAMTMDFRPDRVTVSYDAQMLVTQARCG